MTFATDFWPLFWTIIGSAAVLTVLVTLLVATFTPAWFGSQRHDGPAQLAPAHRPAGAEYPATRHSEAA